MEVAKRIERKILLSRLLTRSGDQAWSFAVSIILIQVFSKQTLPAILYFFILMLGSVFITPHIGRFIDIMPRFTLVKAGIFLQMTSITLALATIVILERLTLGQVDLMDSRVAIPLALLVVFGLINQSGNSIMEITIANDIVPTLVPPERMGAFNSRFRQVDLFSEVGCPVLAGLILGMALPSFRLAGFALIWLWNFISFVPEYQLLKASFALSPALRAEKPAISMSKQGGFWSKLLSGLPEFRSQAILPAMIAYSLLWLSALSPHGVLLTAFLKNGWNLSESMLGGFRGLAAIFGLLATLAFPVALQRWGLLKTSKMFLALQAIAVSLALLGFHENVWMGHMAFLGMILISRIGLYGFSLAEGQMRQMYISESQRGRVNGTASSFNSLATVILFTVGMLFPDPHQFQFLVYLSVLSVVSASIILLFWKPDISDIKKPLKAPAI